MSKENGVPTDSEKAGHEFYMRRALELAKEGLCTASPNPMVGAVVVKGGRIIGEGFHRRAGEPHAEPIALGHAGEDARGSTLYVTLEPCCHQGRTPPCADRVVESGVSRVFAAMEDPFPEVSGRGFQRLRDAGIEVHPGLLESEARRLNAPFIKRVTTGLPWVTIKAAVTLDGKMATRTGDSKWITGEQAREEAHRIRARSDCVLVGIGTVLADDPLLTVRLPGDHGQQWRGVLDTHAKLNEKSRLVQSASLDRPVFDFVSGGLETVSPVDGFERIPVRSDSSGRICLESVLKELARRGANAVMIEGGPSLIGECLRLDMADQAAVFVAPVIVGDSKAPSLADSLSPESVVSALRLRDVEIRTFGSDVLIQGDLEKEGGLP